MMFPSSCTQPGKQAVASCSGAAALLKGDSCAARVLPSNGDSTPRLLCEVCTLTLTGMVAASEV